MLGEMRAAAHAAEEERKLETAPPPVDGTVAAHLPHDPIDLPSPSGDPAAPAPAPGAASLQPQPAGLDVTPAPRRVERLEK